MRRDLALILAGGKGTRLEPLTRDRAKPAVPFGGSYRIIDFTLSNCLNSGLRRILVLTQYKAASLDRHVNQAWRFLCRELDEYVDVLPPQQRLDEQWYQGTADAVYQNIYTIEKTGAENVLILSGDHIYKMDYSLLMENHRKTGAAVTIGCLPVSIEEGRQFGVMSIDSDQRVVDFQEKPANPQALPGSPNTCLASMGIYVFQADVLYEELCKDATIRDSSHDFGKDLLPRLINEYRVQAYPFQDKNTGEKSYWRDVGTLDAYYEANMDLVSVDPQLNLYDQSWPIRSYQPLLPPPKFVFAQENFENPRVGYALDSLVCSGSILSGGKAIRSIIGANVKINSWSTVEDSILFDNVTVGRRTRIRRAIIDKGVEIPAGITIGYDVEQDRARGFTVTESGIVAIGKVGLIPEPLPA
ncbi:glucose-1-phosphate adenylyltransferase [Rubinisphaera brasiliensis]|uniref:Glucose-1-phosphate adenylyltransferase n=1 Tax=Rubinisphaera brasiliensis (strain ATCC 49424 / DSM 5305 / JCM 21570 / IAM 15109 / NBRC 103401 / IFAM 1448) TaxID=756272 RepID=F0SKY3_RUBBR|nr:glucose-1-phosphate adenylyltransferase [Rubinisphaera brasiliensis]ADY59836.1 Glucose-1-phosphate adenylyltransferase [Rubinisphaera brasiliensis DSM 5305]